MSDLSAQQLDELSNDLVKLEQALNAMLADTKMSAQPVDLHEPIGRLTRVDAMHQQEILNANRTLASNRLRQISSAQKRLTSGNYGYCIDCDESIAFARLKAYPETPHCLECQSRSEAKDT
jgi:DnaK suppressor protein